MEKIKAVLYSVLLGLFICLAWIAIVSTLLSKAFESIPFYRLGFWGTLIQDMITIVVLAIPVIIVVLVKGIRTRCSSCKKLLAMKEMETIVLARKPKYIKVMNNTYSKYSGEVAYESEQRILGTHKTLKTRYACKYCNAEQYKVFYQDTQEPWQE